MKRRHLLGLGALGALGLWAMRPGDQGRPHAPYFASLQNLLKQEGGGVPQLVIDLDRLDANADLLAQRLGTLPLRLVAKSLASNGLLEYLAKRLDTRRFMVFHQPQINQLAQAFPDADLLLGKPLPVAAALAFYQQLGNGQPFDPSRQLTWLVDSPQRLAQYLELAQALQKPMSIALEIDIGLQRGGHPDAASLAQTLRLLAGNQPLLHLRGLMGYDAQVAHAPFWTGSQDAFEAANARYTTFIEAARGFPAIWPREPLLNGAGSLTYPLHAKGKTPLNEVAIGSALLKPLEFDTPLLASHQGAIWIATPVLKMQSGTLPYLQQVQGALEAWNPNRHNAYYLYGGRWPAQPVSPEGLAYDGIYGRSANQERLIGSPGTALAVDDWVFLRPLLCEGLFDRFGELRLLRHGKLVGTWKPQPAA
ncbi:alanine racemase [Pseudomonas tohonis]|uniref:alanine racemase n=1 Tax=Pseudomonas tohonis TaxID=2725477 RepID=UPI00255C21B0|nr:alanine racemase [Pseudomonas tohonis]